MVAVKRDTGKSGVFCESRREDVLVMEEFDMYVLRLVFPLERKGLRAFS